LAATPAYDNTLAKGKVTDTIICSAQKEQSYALYLPSYYTSAKAYPCIFFFDAHARGPLPLKMYKDLAEKYGFILIGSNVSKNGMSPQQAVDVANTMITDACARINIDAKRMYVAGFSGGARVAGTVAVQNNNIAGVIACAAGLPNTAQPLQSKFNYFGMVGVYDFNLTELQHQDQTLEQNGFTHQLLTFQGKHAWPPAADFEMAILWLQANAMKENLQPKNDSLLSALNTNYSGQISMAVASKDFIKEQQLLAGAIKVLNGLSDVSAYQKQLTELLNANNYKAAVEQQTQLQQLELSSQQSFAQEFTQHDDKWWAQQINSLRHSVKTAKTQYEAQMYQRLINFLGLLCYLNTDHALNTGDLTNAGVYLKVFKLADPQNPDCYYLSAIYYMRENDRQQAIAALKDAAKLGYSDVALLLTNPVFDPIQADPAFKDIIIKAVQNVSKQ